MRNFSTSMLAVIAASTSVQGSFNHYASRDTAVRSTKRILASCGNDINDSHERCHSMAAPLSKPSRPLAFATPDVIISTISHPYAAAFVISAAKGVVADWFAQTSSIRKNAALQANMQQDMQQDMQQGDWENCRGGAAAISLPPQQQQVNMKRIIAFSLYSGIYLGTALEFMYNTIYPLLFGTSVLKKVAFSVFLVSPLLTLPLAYVSKSLAFRQPMADGIREYWHDVVNKGLLTTYWAVWIPVKFVTFGMIPAHLRVSFLSVFGFLWMIMFSALSSDKSS